MERKQNNKALFRRILVASDLSDAADQVMTCLPGLRRLGTEQVILCHALGIRHLDVMSNELARLVERRLKAQKALLESEGFDVEVQVASGLAPLEVNRIAAEQHASLIVIGSHGATLARDVLLGSVAVHILHYASLPVLVFRVRGFGAEGNSPDIQVPVRSSSIRCCTPRTSPIQQDTRLVRPGSRGRWRKGSYLIACARSGASGKSLVAAPGGKQRNCPGWNASRRFSKREVPMRFILKSYTAYQSGKLRTAREDRGTRVVVMGSQRKGFIADVFLGSVSHQVVRQATQPVLLIPPRR